MKNDAMGDEHQMRSNLAPCAGADGNERLNPEPARRPSASMTFEHVTDDGIPLGAVQASLEQPRRSAPRPKRRHARTP
jgi:hypothetical protein